MPKSTELDDILNQLKAFEALLTGMANSTGASAAMGVSPQWPTQGAPNLNIGAVQRGNPYGTSAPLDSGSWKQAVGGPGQPIGPSYAPQGVIFGGGSPFPVDPGPARLQNSLVGLRDLMNTPLGQDMIAKLKEKLGYKGSLDSEAK